LIDTYKDHCNRGIEQLPFSEEMKTRIELLHILKEARVPHYLYQNIWKWAQSAVDRKVPFHDAGTRESILNDLMYRYNLDDTLPVTTAVTLPGSGETVDITIHEFLPQLYSLLTDPTLMHDDNLLFWDDDPFGKPVPRRGGSYELVDIIDGSVYREAYHTHVKDCKRDLLVPIILYIDKTHVDASGRLCLEPVTFTLGIFKKEVRKDPMAWRPLGFIPNQSNIEAVKPIEKAQDYHYILGFILGSLRQAQESNGIAWCFKYRNQFYNVVMKVPILFVIGDTEGHDKLCGKYTNRVVSKHLCRYCDCPRDRTGRAHTTFQYIKASQIAKLVSQKDENQLKQMSYHCVENCFTNLTFCDPKFGINGATLAELLHLVQHGIYLYFVTALVGEKAVKKSANKVEKGAKKSANMGKNREDAFEDDDDACKKKRARMGNKNGQPKNVDGSDGIDSEDGSEFVIGDTIDEDDSSSDNSYQSSSLFDLSEGAFRDFRASSSGYQKCEQNGVFTNAVKLEFNNLAKDYGRLLSHQSNREFERAYFASGIVAYGSKRKGQASAKNMVMKKGVFLCSVI
jgi:hypothetical protein